ncbi:MAG: undecaprenyl-diphosphate phosphatase [Dysosmobacter welbionis]
MLSSILLGLIQGLAEFLPISSSGHLAIAEHFLGQAGVPATPDFLTCCCTWEPWWQCSRPTGRISGT